MSAGQGYCILIIPLVRPEADVIAARVEHDSIGHLSLI